MRRLGARGGRAAARGCGRGPAPEHCSGCCKINRRAPPMFRLAAARTGTGGSGRGPSKANRRSCRQGTGRIAGQAREWRSDPSTAGVRPDPRSLRDSSGRTAGGGRIAEGVEPSQPTPPTGALRLHQPRRWRERRGKTFCQIALLGRCLCAFCLSHPMSQVPDPAQSLTLTKVR